MGSDGVFKKDFNNAESASRFFERGFKVILVIDVHAFFPEKGMHVIVLTSPMTLFAHDTHFTAFNWGQGHFKLPEKGTVTLQHFLDNYYGFIAGKM